MTPRDRQEGRTALIELALFMPVLILLVLGAFSATEYVADRRHVAHVTEQAARFASGAPTDPRSPRPAATRPTPEAVAAYVAQISDLPVVEVVVSPDPTRVFPGSEVTVAVTVHHDLGPLASLADALAGLTGQEQDLSEEGMFITSAVTSAKR